jgi:hypothetical protein
MGTNPLDPRSTPARPDREVTRGHGTRALGPSDSSDSGSDLTNAGPLIGDADLDSDSDRHGTGERAAAGRDETSEDGADIDVDHIERAPDETDDEEEER